MHRSVVTIFAILFAIATFSTFVSGRPTDKLVRYKRQSDQRLAELETLLALQKYRHHHKGSIKPGHGVVDFLAVGRKKKSTRFSPGEKGVGSVFREESPAAFIRAANALSQDEESTPLTFPQPLNEEIDDLLHYQSLAQQNQENAPHTFEEKK